MVVLCMDITKPVELVDVSYFASSREWIFSPEDFDGFVIMLGVTGTAYIAQDRFPYCLEPGNSLLLFSDRTHDGYRSSNKGVSFYRLQFRCAVDLYKVVITSARSGVSPKQLVSLKDLVFIPEFFEVINMARLSVLIHQLLHIANAKYYTPQSANYLLTSFLIEISDQAIRFVHYRNRSKSSRQIFRIADWIKKNIDKSLTLAQLAEKFGYNKNYLTRRFREEIGIPTQQYINLCKVDKAKELLHLSNLNNKEIAYSLGFKDEKYFMRVFKQHEGITMQDFRNAYNRNYLENM